jgi:radical SAM superfamily enzyme YgiQ (UPF0313 family)
MLVGITAMTPHIMQAGKLAEMLKSVLPDIVVAIGGAHVSSVPEETLSRFPAFDVGFIGESDISFPAFLDVLRHRRQWGAVPGLIIRDGEILRRTASPIQRINLSSLPMYAWDILPGFPFLYKTPLFAEHNSPSTPILTSRGCPGKCIFCFSGGHKTLDAYPADYIYSMLVYLKEHFCMREFMIYDDNFVMFRKNLFLLLDLMIDKELGLTWSCNARVDMVDDELLNKMAKAGCWQISFGIETGSPKIMAMIQKNITLKKVITSIKAAKAAGISTVGYFMIGHFEETLETIRETDKFIYESGVDEIRISFFTPLPGTAAYASAKKYGEFEDDWGKMTLFSPVFVPYGMSKEQLLNMQKKMIRRFYLRPKIILIYIRRLHNIKKWFLLFISFIKFLTK